ncbi:MAG: GNAT family N-acetyltransferase [Candidatus Hydrogenedentes bacterium]|nr:GNAT family N-acetyltransferase [Candidatus Hydrogenedentota bacterium]
MEQVVYRAVESDAELRLANDLMAKVHYQDFFAGMHWLETCGAGYPGFLREHTRIAAHRGEIAGALRLNTETIRIGEARLKMGGFGWVTTAPRFRSKGIARALMNDTLGYLRSHRYDVAMLFGIPNFYHKFGFAVTLAEYVIAVDVAEGMRLKCGYRLRTAKPGDIAALQRIHHANDADVACSLLRTGAHITNRWEQSYKAIQTLTTEQGKVCAYFHAHPENDGLSVAEVGVTDPSTYPAVLSACAAYAVEHNLGKMRFYAPPGHPFARFLLQIKSTHEMRVERDAGGMMAPIDIGETLEHMIPEWESLLARSAARELRTEFALVVNHANFRVRANRGAIDVASAPGENKLSVSLTELIQLLTGYLHLDDVIAARRRLIRHEARQLLTALFPKRNPYVWRFDRF